MNSSSATTTATASAGPASAEAVKSDQFTTFYIDDRLYGIHVMKVQEVTRPLPMTIVPLAPDYVCGLINLRGQIATAISLRRLFGIGGKEPEEQMNVVCRIDGHLFSFLVDRIGDVTEVSRDLREETPATIKPEVRRFLDGICKLPQSLLTIVDTEKVSRTINTTESNQGE